MPSTGCSATASATTGSAITSSASGSTTAGCSGGSLTAGSGSTTGVSSVRAGVSTHSSSCALAGSARCAFSLSTTVSVTSTTSSANASGSAFGALGSAGVQPPVSLRQPLAVLLLLLSLGFLCLFFLSKAQPEKKPRFFSFAICDHTPRCLFMAQLHQKLKNDEISWIVYHLT